MDIVCHKTDTTEWFDDFFCLGSAKVGNPKGNNKWWDIHIKKLDDSWLLHHYNLKSDNDESLVFYLYIMRISIVAFLLTLSVSVAAQDLPLPLDNPSYQLLDRLMIRFGFAETPRPAFNPSLRPIGRGAMVRLLKTYEYRYADQLSPIDRFQLQYAYDDNNEWLALPILEEGQKDHGQKWLIDSMAMRSTLDRRYQTNRKSIFNYFYRTPANLLETNQADFFLRLNPILDLRYGKIQDDTEDYIYNRRGLELRGGVDDRLFFYFQILETQNSLPNYLRSYQERFAALPGAGFVKPYQGFGINEGVDFLNSQGYLSFDITPHVGARLGYGNHFIGKGQRSLLLSDFSNNYPFLQLNWRVWKFHYQNLFAELTAGPFSTTVPGQTLPKKYLASHHLSIDIGERLNVGVFEAVVLSRSQGFELAYLNPVIFYRAVEGSLGSPDNVLIGFDGSYQLPPSLRFYAQFILDEFVFSGLITDNQGWWANKWGVQAGVQYTNAFGLDQLDLQFEHNRARPYLYTHRSGINSHTHFGMPLAHPLGGNFKESIFLARYRPLERLQLQARLYLIEQGEDDLVNDLAFGEDINRPNEDRVSEYGNEIGQGINYNTTLISLEAEYMLRHNLFLEGVFLQRSKQSVDAARSAETTYLNLGLRLNVARRRDYF